MNKCRICLSNNKKTLLSIFKDDKGISYADMITSIARVMVSKDDCITKMICRGCRQKLAQAYEFKLLIERSNAALYEVAKVKKLSFNNLNDIKVMIEIDCKETKPLIPLYENVKQHFNTGVSEIFYNNTIIKKKDVSTSSEDENKPIPVLDFLKTLKEENDDFEYNDNYYDEDNVETDTGNDKNLPINLLLKRAKANKKLRHRKKELEKYGPESDEEYLPQKPKKPKEKIKQKIRSTDETATYIKPIKPVLLKDFRVIPTYKKSDQQNKTKKKRPIKRSMCPYCGLLKTYLHKHILLHTGERRYKCDKCEKAFFTKSTLLNHLIKHGTRNYKCTYESCTAAFYDVRSFRSHMLVHTQEKKCICDVCSKSFKRKAALRRHMLGHSAKTVLCELCNMSFNTKEGLRHHMRVHTGERPYNCEICSQPYSYKHDFNRHCFKKHGVFLKRRSVYVMNEEVLKQEKLLMRDIMLRVSGVIKDDKPLNPFEGPQAAQAFAQFVKALESNQIPIDFHV